MRKHYFAPLLVAVFSTILSAQTDSGSTSALHKESVMSNFGKSPLSFEANNRQTDDHVKFFSRGSGFSLLLTNNEAIVALHKASHLEANAKKHVRNTLPIPNRNESPTGDTLRMELLGANPTPRVAGAEELPGNVNYFIGNDPSKWRTKVPTYAKVKYAAVYPGVDLVYYGIQGQLEYDFVVAPGADPNRIQLKFRGAKNLRVEEKGDLLLGAAGEEVRFQKPVVYQTAEGVRKPVEGSYVIAAGNVIAFRLGEYNHRRPLVIDPVLVYSTYLGGTYEDLGTGIAVDAAGNAYVTGYTSSIDFPTANPLQSTYVANTDGFVTKINASGSALVYSTYLGGSGADFPSRIAVDGSGNAYVTGYTSSTDFPTANALQATFGGGSYNAFVTKISPSGSALVYSTYLGGNISDAGWAIAVDGSGNAYVAGETASGNFPTANALQSTYAGSTDAFVSKINATGSALVYSTYLGGFNEDFAYGIAADGSGNAYVTGQTSSGDFPTVNPLQSTLAGGFDAFVAKINASGSVLVYSTYLGGGYGAVGQGIAVDTSGNAYVTGGTYSTDFPTVDALQPTSGGGEDAFVSKINATGSALVYSTYLGGAANDYGTGIAVNASGNAYVTGSTLSTDFPTVDALQMTFGGFSDAFVSMLNARGSALVYSTYLGGSDEDQGLRIAVDASGSAYVTGYTFSTNFPTANALQPALAGASDAFITKIRSDARTIKESVRRQLEGSLSGSTKHDAKELQKVIEYLSNSLVPALWGSDGNHLNPRSGQAVFEQEVAAVEELGKLIQDRNHTISTRVLEEYINNLVEADRILASTSIINAARGNANDIAKANHYLDKGDKDMAEGMPGMAIRDYEHAWVIITGQC